MIILVNIEIHRVYFMKLEILKPGILIRDEKNVILNAESSVTLIQTENKNIIIDTSVARAKNEILSGLKRNNLTPAEIDFVFCTHNHIDHVSNNILFENSKIYVNRIELKTIKRSNMNPLTIDPDKPYQFLEGISLIATPGHTLGSTSVFIELNENKYVITGDAIPIRNNFLKWIPPIVNVDPDKCLKSMEKIKKIADYIIPGHDYMFKT